MEVLEAVNDEDIIDDYHYRVARDHLRRIYSH